MRTTFYKYQGTGNDFVIVDDREGKLKDLNADIVSRICNRRFGIGADGFIVLRNKPGYDFAMVYYNADGNESSMCGNGGRCIVAFAGSLGIIKDKARFYAIDGGHEALLKQNGSVVLRMQDVKVVEKRGDNFFLNTGSPHYVKWVSGVEKFDVFSEGKKIRNSDAFKKEGTNVNFIEQQNGSLFVRTYERGVEDETYSCGTGVTAAALVSAVQNDLKEGVCKIKTLGGDLLVSYQSNGEGFNNIWLEGPAQFVFKGEVEI